MSDNKKTYFDVVIVGGGASGLMCAVSLAKKRPELRIAILEALERVGKKLAVTGNGQCNISNKNLNIDRYHGKNVSFAEDSLNRFGFEYCKSFFEEIGIDIVCKENGKAYPRSFQASSVVDALRFEAESLGISVICECRVNGFSKSKDLFEVVSSKGCFPSRYLIMATGLLSGGEKVGSFGDGVRMLEAHGFSRVKMTPSIVQLKASSDYLRRLKGVKVDATATLKIDGKMIKSDTDEVLFTEYGLSGPAVLQLSRETARTDKKCEISLDLIPDVDKQQLIEMLYSRREALSGRFIENFLTTMLQNRLAQTLLVACGFSLKETVGALSDADLEKLAELIKNFSFNVTGNTGFIHSQVTAGGIDTDAFDSKTMQSKKIKGLFCLGELLDIDGDCGGFNLAWSFASAFSAADFIAGED